MNYIATAIALLAAVIAAMQWWNSRQQFVYNLFEKRFAVYKEVRTVASEAIQLGRINSKGLTNEIYASGRFLFGDDLEKALARLHELASELEGGQSQRSHRHFKSLRCDGAVV